MSSSAFSSSNGPKPKLSLGRRGQQPATKTSAAADEAIQHILDRRRRRNKFGSEETVRPSVLAGAVDAVADSIGPARRLVLSVVALTTLGLLSAGAIFAFAGQRSSVHVLSGTVKLGDKPLANATLEFHRVGQAETVLQQRLQTGPDGTFAVDPANPVPRGLYAVVVVPAAGGGVRPKPGKEAIPAAYRNPKTSPLKLDVFEDLADLRLEIRKKG